MAEDITIHVNKSDDLLKEVPVDGKEDEKYDIKIVKDTQDIKFEKIEDKKPSKDKITVQVKKCGKEGET